MSAKVITKSVKDKDVTEMFNQMLGTGQLNLDMCYPKYENIKNYTEKILEVLCWLNKAPFLNNYDELKICRNDINKFVEESRKEHKEIFNMNFGNYELEGKNLNLLDDKIKKEFEEKYELMKKSTLICSCLNICNNLIIYKKYLKEDEKEIELNKLDTCKFIRIMAGCEFCPFPFSNLNFKYLIDDLSNKDPKESKGKIKLIYLVLVKLLNLTFKMYKVYNNPDFDVDEFSQIIMTNITKVKSQIPRCNKAFKKIEESVSVLKDNFGDYYKDFVQTQNQTIIIEDFISDVAKNTTADPETTRQFRKIIEYYRKMANQQIKNPKIKILFDKVNESFAVVDKHENLVGIKKLSDDESEEDEEDGKEEIHDIQPEITLKEKEQKYMEKSVEQLMEESNLKD